MLKLIRKKPQLIAISGMMLLAQCCFCILPLEWQVQNGGATIAGRNAPVQLAQEAILCTVDEGDARFALGRDGQPYHSQDGGENWLRMEDGSSFAAQCLRSQ